MVPAFFVLLDHFPLTSNGKLDLRALPDPLQQDRPLGESAAPPIEPGQEILQTIWRAVLARKSIGLDDRFFEMGGHSLLAVRLASRMGRAFKQTVPIRAIFDHPTIRQQAAWLERISRGDSQEEPVPPLLRQPREVLQPLSFSQQRLWFLHQLEGPNSAYNMFGTVRVQGPFQAALFERGIRIILERHEALRMGFFSREGEPAQYLRPDDFSPVEFVDLAGMDADSRKNELERVLRQRIDQPFDLVSGNLLRVRVCRCGEEDTVFQVVMHHLVSDGWSVGLFVRELSEIYSALASGATPRLPELTVQFVDYVLWQRKRFEGKGLEREVQYWRQRLHGAPSLLPLPTDRPRPAAQSYRGSTLRCALPETLSRRWIGFQESRGSTLFMTLQAAFAVFLCRISRQQEVVIGTAVANRHAPETEPLIGFFANTLALRTSLASDPSFIRLLEQVQESVLEDFSHQEVPFEHLVEALRPDRNLAHSPIFQVMLVLQNALMPPKRLGDLALEFHEIPNHTAKFDLTVFVETTESGLVMKWEYNTDLFDPYRVRCLAASFETLLRGILAEPEAPVSRLPLASAEERQRQLRMWNDTVKDYGAYRSMVDDFEQQAEAFPDRVAVVFEERSHSYGELNRLAEELAAFLQAQGIRGDQLVGVFLERSLELVVGLFGILKAGGAYVPLDPEYPPDRLAFMLEDSAISVVLTQERLRPVLASLGGNAIRSVCLDSKWPEVVQKGRGSVGRRPVRHPSQLAYMILHLRIHWAA